MCNELHLSLWRLLNQSSLIRIVYLVPPITVWLCWSYPSTAWITLLVIQHYAERNPKTGIRGSTRLLHVLQPIIPSLKPLNANSVALLLPCLASIFLKLPPSITCNLPWSKLINPLIYIMSNNYESNDSGCCGFRFPVCSHNVSKMMYRSQLPTPRQSREYKGPYCRHNKAAYWIPYCI